jgi:LmbE family N-acetylglucosaminyl deacetylase
MERNGKGILAIVSHPDDETFGCGGTLALHAVNGFATDVLCLTCSSEVRLEEINEASRALGISEPIVFDKKQITLDEGLTRMVSKVITSRRPRIVITHVPFDYHREHRLAHGLVKEAVEWAAHYTTNEEPWIVERLLLMEVNTLIPSPHVLVDISKVIQKKVDAIEEFQSQLEKIPWGYYESFNLKKAELRGIQGGCGYAEAFQEEPLARNSPFYNSKCTLGLL